MASVAQRSDAAQEVRPQLALLGCASNVTRTGPRLNTRTHGSKSQLADNIKFDPEGVMLQRTRQCKRLVAADGDFEMSVVIDDIRVRSIFNALMWGFMAGDDHLNGTVALSRRGAEP